MRKFVSVASFVLATLGVFPAVWGDTSQYRVQSFPLNPYVPVLDGQWQGIKFASDGNCYFASSTHDNKHGAAFFRYQPSNGTVTMLAEDMTRICGEDPTVTPPQGKIHNNIVEYNGWLYLATYLANYWDPAQGAYTGSHVVGYELATGKFRDFGIVRSNYSIYAGLAVDPVRNKLVVHVVRWWGTPADSHVYRIDLATGAKEDLATLSAQGAAFYSFVDKRGDCWISQQYDGGSLVCVRSATGAVERWVNVLPESELGTPRFWDWSQALPDGDRCVFRLMFGTKLHIFDSSKFPADPVGAFQQIQDIGPSGAGAALSGDRVYYIQRANRQTGWQEYQDFHLMSTPLDPNAAPGILDHGLILDQSGRLVWRVHSLAADSQRRMYMTGDWWLLPGEQGTSTGTLRHVDGPGSDYTAEPRGEFFAVTALTNAELLPPAVTLLTPTAGQIVSNSVTVSATASDNAAVAGVQFQLDGANLGAAVTSQPYSVVWDTLPTSNGPHSLKALAWDTSGNSATSVAAVVTVSNPVAGTTGLAGFWSFNTADISGNLLLDRSGNSSDATSYNTTSLTGQVGQARHFNGVNSYAPVNADTKLRLTSDRTLSFWLRTSNTTRTEGVLSCYDAGGMESGYLLRTTSTGFLDLRIGGYNMVGGSGRDAIDNRKINDGNWHYVVVTIKLGTGVTFYIDGTRSSATTLNILSSPGGATFRFGNNPYLDYGNYFTGDLDEARVYSRALTDAEAAALYQPGGVVTDLVPPTVSLTAPANSQIISNSLVVSATASDNVSLAGVQFKLDGANLGAEDNTAPYSTSWNTTASPNGPHSLSAIARDTSGNLATATVVSVTVNNDLTPPTVSLTAPTNNQIVSNSFLVSTTAADNVAVAGVQFKLDGANLGAEVSATPYSVGWNTAQTGNGLHTLMAVARDTAGNLATSAVVSVTVTNPLSMPSGLEAFWSFDTNDVSGSVLLDRSGTGSDLNTYNTTPVSGVVGQALHYNGVNSFSPIVDAHKVRIIGDQTFSFWLRTANSRRYEAVLSRYDAVGAETGYLLRTSPAGVLEVRLGGNSTSVGVVTKADTTRINDSAWHHVVVMIQVGRGITFYVDGNLSSSASVNVLAGTGGSPFQIGVNPWTDYGNSFTGDLDQVRNYSRILTTSEVVALYQEGAGGGTGGTGSDTNAPSVAMTAPTNTQTVAATVTVTASATDNMAVAGVQFKLDGANLGAEDTAIPYSVSWNTTSSTNGPHSLCAIARDTSGNLATATVVSVTVSNDLTPPTISLTAPTNNQIVSNSFLVSATASDNIAVAGVQFKLDGANLGAEDTAIPYSVSWNTTSSTNGPHSLCAIARDTSGNLATATVVSVMVNNDLTPPTVSLTTPTNNQIVSNSFLVSATVSDNIAVTGVQFKLDGANLGAELSAAPYSFAWNTTQTGNGPHTLLVVARDSAGNLATSAVVSVTVNNSPSLPTGLLGFWSFDSADVSGNLLLDRSGNGSDATSYNTTSLTGQVGQARHFNGANSFAPVNADANLRLTGDRTLAFWLRTANATRLEGLLSCYDASGTEAGYLLRTTPTGFLNLRIGGNNMTGGAGRDALDTRRINDGLWHHVVVTIKLGSGVTFYIDGVRTSATTLNILAGAGGTTFRFGTNPFLEYANYFTGDLDEARVYSRALTDAEAAALYQPGVIVGDTTAPTVSLIAPANNQIVSNSFLVSATAADNVAVAGVQFKLDGANLGAEVSAAPYSVAWNTISSTNGLHSLYAIARDTSGNLATAAVVLATVSNDLTAPTISLTAPTNNQIVSNSFLVGATASDNVAVAGVQFKLDGANLGTEVSTAPYSFTWNTAQTGNGPHTLSAVARDNAGNLATAAVVSVTVSNPLPTLPTGLLAFWSFDTADTSGNLLLDRSGNHSDATSYNTTSLTGAIGQARHFNGANSYAPVSADTNLRLTGDRTLAFWLRTANTTRSEGLLSCYDASGSEAGYLLRTTATGFLDLRIGGNNMLGGAGRDAFDTRRINDGLWHYIVVSIKLGSGVTFYIDGTRTSATTLNILAGPGGAMFRFGNNPYLDYGNYFTGDLDEARIYSRALTDAEAAALYQPGIVVLDSVPPTVSLTAPNNNQIVSNSFVVSATANDNTGVAGVQFKVDSTNLGAEVSGSPYVISWNTTQIGNGAHTLTAVARDLSGNQSTSTPVNVTVNNGPNSMAGIIARWSFDTADVNGNTFYDRSGNGSDATSYNTAIAASSAVGQARNFNGVNAYCVVPNDTNLQLTGDRSFSFWLRTVNNVNVWEGLFCRYDAVGSESGYIVRTAPPCPIIYQNGVAYVVNCSPNRVLGVRLGGNSLADNATRVINDTTPINDGRWHHAVVTLRIGVGVSFYVDGVFSSASNGVPIIASTGGLPFQIGANPWLHWGGYFTGDLDQVRVFNRPLTDADVSALYQEGAALISRQSASLRSAVTPATLADNGGLDTDGDGLTDAQEKLAGTDPANANSRLQMLRVVASQTKRGVTLTWSTVPGKTYQVQYSRKPNGPWHETLRHSRFTAGIGQWSATYTDTTAPRVGRRYYRVRLSPAVQTTTEVVGVYGVTLHPGDNPLAMPLQRLADYRGAVVSAASSNTVTLGTTAGFVPGQFAPQDGRTQYMLLVRQDAAANPGITGDWWPITGNTATQVTVANGPDDLGRLLTGGTEIEIRHLTTVKDLFGSAVADTDQLWLGPGAPITYQAGYYQNGVLFGDGSTLTLDPDQAVTVSRPAEAGPVVLRWVGQVQTTALTHYLLPGIDFIGNPFPVAARLDQTGLASSGWNAEDDLIQVVGPAGLGAPIYYQNGAAGSAGWYVGGVLSNGVALLPARAYRFLITPGSEMLRWRQPAP